MSKENNVPQAIETFASRPDYVKEYCWRVLKDVTGEAKIYGSLFENRGAVTVFDFYRSKGLLFNITVDLDDKGNITGLCEKHFHAWADLGAGLSFQLTYEEDSKRPGMAVLTRVQDYADDNNPVRDLGPKREQAVKEELIGLGHPQEVLYEETVMYYLTNDKITAANIRERPYITSTLSDFSQATC